LQAGVGRVFTLRTVSFEDANDLSGGALAHAGVEGVGQLPALTAEGIKLLLQLMQVNLAAEKSFCFYLEGFVFPGFHMYHLLERVLPISFIRLSPTAVSPEEGAWTIRPGWVIQSFPDRMCPACQSLL
jgi:hypothetical protein